MGVFDCGVVCLGMLSGRLRPAKLNTASAFQEYGRITTSWQVEEEKRSLWSQGRISYVVVCSVQHIPCLAKTEDEPFAALRRHFGNWARPHEKLRATGRAQLQTRSNA